MTPEEYRAKSVEAHKGIIDRMIKADDEQAKEEAEKLQEQQAAPYLKELQDIQTRVNQSGVATVEDLKRVREVNAILKSIQNGKYEETDEDMQRMMSDSVNRIQEARRRQSELRRKSYDDGF